MAGLTMTDSTGHYKLEDIPVGRYFVVAGSLDNLSYYPTSITLTAVSPLDNIDFFLSESYDGVIEVNVHPSGATTPVPGAQVRIRSTSASLTRASETNAGGIASIFIATLR
jgi:hypothetical protein